MLSLTENVRPSSGRLTPEEKEKERGSQLGIALQYYLLLFFSWPP